MGRAKSAIQLAISFGEECHPGLKRADNQDSVAHGTTPFGELFVVSDGVGGYYGGAEASAIVANGLPRHLSGLAVKGTLEDTLSEAVQRVNAEVFAAGQSGDASRRRMSATVVLALLVCHKSRSEAIVANVGDSRAYLVRNGQMTQLSIDHTAVQGMVDAGVLTPEQARDHPHASVLTRTIGQGPEVTASLKRVLLQPQDQLLLCSDGLHGYVDAAAILATLTNVQSSPSASAKQLLDLALAAGGHDNVSIQVIRLADAGPVDISAARKRPTLVAIYAAGAIVAMSAAGAGAYWLWQTNQATPQSTTAAMSHPGRSSSQTPMPVPVPRVAGVTPSSGPEMLPYRALRRRWEGIAEVDANHHESCASLAGDTSLAYYATEDVRKMQPASDPEIAGHYKFKLVTGDVERACGHFELLLIPGHYPTTSREAVPRQIDDDAKKARQVIEADSPFRIEVDKPHE